jgi:hypothetical protein
VAAAVKRVAHDRCIERLRVFRQRLALMSYESVARMTQVWREYRARGGCTCYGTIAEDAKGLEAREHTAQMANDVRQEREGAFRRADLPILYRSPTMELGVDIAEPNAVNMVLIGSGLGPTMRSSNASIS